MAKLQVLTSTAHADAGVVTEYLPQLGYAQGAVMVLPNEILHAQRELALLFRKHPETGRLHLNALLGFDEKENLFLDEQGGWKGNYVPMAFEKGPFLITFQGEGNQKAVLSVDIEDPRYQEQGGEKLFNSKGQPSEYLQKVNNVLAAMHEGMQMVDPMVDAFNKYELIEPVSLDIQLANGEKINFAGAYTIAEEKLRKLEPQAVSELNVNGMLSAAYYIAGSLSNVKNLINFKNALI